MWLNLVLKHNFRLASSPSFSCDWSTNFSYKTLMVSVTTIQDMAARTLCAVLVTLSVPTQPSTPRRQRQAVLFLLQMAGLKLRVFLQYHTSLWFFYYSLWFLLLYRTATIFFFFYGKYKQTGEIQYYFKFLTLTKRDFCFKGFRAF